MEVGMVQFTLSLLKLLLSNMNTFIMLGGLEAQTSRYGRTWFGISPNQHIF